MVQIAKTCNALLCLLLVCSSICVQSVPGYRFSMFLPFSRTLYICVSKDVRIRGYFSKPRGVSQQRSLGNTALRCTVAPQRTQAPNALNCVVAVVFVVVQPLYFIFVTNSLHTHIICTLNCRLLTQSFAS
jgi:hypothetical protein